jgi:hypothetical protein
MIMGLLKSLWGSSFRTPWFLIAVAVAGIAGFSYGYGLGSAGVELAQLKAEVVTLKRDRAIAEAAELDAKTKADALDARSTELEKQVAEYAAELAQHGDDNRCALSDDDARRLQRIR